MIPVVHPDLQIRILREKQKISWRCPFKKTM